MMWHSMYDDDVTLLDRGHVVSVGVAENISARSRGLDGVHVALQRCQRWQEPLFIFFLFIIICFWSSCCTSTMSSVTGAPVFFYFVYMYIYIYMYIYTHIHKHTYTHTYILERTVLRNTHTHTHVLSLSLSLTHTSSRSLTRSLSLSHTCIKKKNTWNEPYCDISYCPLWLAIMLKKKKTAHERQCAWFFFVLFR